MKEQIVQAIVATPRTILINTTTVAEMGALEEEMRAAGFKLTKPNHFCLEFEPAEQLLLDEATIKRLSSYLNYTYGSLTVVVMAHSIKL